MGNGYTNRSKTNNEQLNNHDQALKEVEMNMKGATHKLNGKNQNKRRDTEISIFFDRRPMNEVHNNNNNNNNNTTLILNYIYLLLLLLLIFFVIFIFIILGGEIERVRV